MKRPEQGEVDGAAFFRERLSEDQFQRDIIKHARALGWLVYHTHISKRSTEGWPDLAMVRDGRLVLAELKREKPLLKSGLPSAAQDLEPSPAQERWLEELRRVEAEVAAFSSYAARIIYVGLWRPSDWPEIEAVLR